MRNEFIIVSGDRALYSAVLKIVKQGFPVHVWSWQNALAGVYSQQEEGLVQVHLLNDYLEEIGFRETNFRVERDAISPHSIVILDHTPKSDAVYEFVSGLRTPVYQYVHAKQRADASSKDLVIIPVFTKAMKHEELVDLFQAAAAKLKTCGIRILTYFEYVQLYFKSSSKDELELSNQFRELPPSDEEKSGDSER